MISVLHLEFQNYGGLSPTAKKFGGNKNMSMENNSLIYVSAILTAIVPSTTKIEKYRILTIIC
jgi:hypothetical protein